MASKKPDEEKVVKLMVDTYEAGVNGSIALAKIPLVMCKSFTVSWAKGLESILDGLKADSKGD